MNRTAFIRKLDHFVKTRGSDTPDGYGRIGYRPNMGTVILVKGISEYLTASTFDGGVGVDWLKYLPKMLADAFAEFRAAEKWEALRAAYRDETGEDIPDLVKVHIGRLHRLLVCHEMVRLLPILGDAPWLDVDIDSVVNHERAAIDAAWWAFVRLAYQPFMARIKAERHRGNRGEFGATELLTYAMAGRVMFTFRRGDADMTYIADDGDSHGYRSGPNATTTPYAECVSMIEEVTAHWDMGKMKRDDGIGMG